MPPGFSGSAYFSSTLNDYGTEIGCGIFVLYFCGWVRLRSLVGCWEVKIFELKLYIAGVPIVHTLEMVKMLRGFSEYL